MSNNSTFLIEQSEYLKQLYLFPIPYSEVDKNVLRKGIKFILTQSFSIPYPITCKYFKSYFLLYWNGDHILNQIQAGYIEKDGIAYDVIYHRDLTRGKILQHHKAQFALSFRQPNLEWNLPAVVLISNAGE